MSVSTVRQLILVALILAGCVYLYGRYTAYAARDRAITLCMQGHSAAREMCERAVDSGR